MMSCNLPPWRTVRCASRAPEKKIAIVGGTGRVGSSTARALKAPDLKLVLVGRNQDIGDALAAEIGNGTKFIKADIEDKVSLDKAIQDADLVVHAAGPFQRTENCSVLQAAIRCKTPYVDVCDDLEHARRAKALHEDTIQAGIPALITTGIYPGISNLMAAELVRLAERESQTKSLRFSYFTAGTGGAGPTILATSFLLLGEEVLTYREGTLSRRKPYSGELIVDFGKGIGKRSVFLLNLPEVASAHHVLGVPTVSARFGTSPFLWNWVMSYLAGKEFLQDRKKVDGLVNFSNPAVRAIDALVGEKMSMRVDLECKDGKKSVGLFTHKRLSVCVGRCVAAFARAVIEGSSQPGVWFPEQVEGLAVEDRHLLLKRASKGTISYEMNRPPWMIETDAKEIGFGIYLE